MNPSDRKAQPSPVDETPVIDALVRTAFFTTAVLSRIAAEHDLSLTQLRVLAILRDRQGSMSDLATYLGLDKSTVSGLVDRAEKRGLLRRSQNPLDGRGVDVALTAQGIELAERGAATVARELSPLTRALNPAEIRRLTALLELMLGAAEVPSASHVPGRSGAVRVRPD
jgi:DNA-binding MarR family transcriptional regulator